MYVKIEIQIRVLSTNWFTLSPTVALTTSVSLPQTPIPPLFHHHDGILSLPSPLIPICACSKSVMANNDCSHEHSENNDHLIQSNDPLHPANMIPDLCKKFWGLGWVTGTGRLSPFYAMLRSISDKLTRWRDEHS